jgi:prolyl-tRNA synthetase
MRGREFGMKDMYSFHTTQEDFERFYEIVKQAYLRVYTRCGLTAKVTEASGGSFSTKISYEFMVLTDAGEDTILYCNDCDYCANIEVAKQQEGDICPKCGKSKLQKAVASEVGNVFDLGDRYPKAFNFTYKAEDGSDKYPIMGCFGIGTSRLMGVIVEKYADEKGLVWPTTIAPFAVHLVAIGEPGSAAMTKAESYYTELQGKGIEVLFDDRDLRAGEKFTDADLLGIPLRVVVSDKTLAQNKIEVKERTSATAQLISDTELYELLHS